MPSKPSRRGLPRVAPLRRSMAPARPRRSLSGGAAAPRASPQARRTAVRRRIGVILIDPLPVVRAGLALLVAERPDMDVLAEAGDADANALHRVVAKGAAAPRHRDLTRIPAKELFALGHGDRADENAQAL